MIQLSDGSKHDTKELADKHIKDILNSDKYIDIKEYLIVNQNRVVKVLQLIRELNEIKEKL